VGSFARACRAGAALGVVVAVAIAATGAPAGARSERGRGKDPVVVLDPVARRLIAADRVHNPAPPSPTAGDAAVTAVAVAVPPVPLTLLGAPGTLTLTRAGRSGDYGAIVTGVRVVDGRSTKAGWHLAVAVDDAGRGPVRVDVRRVVAFAATTAGIRTRHHSTVRSGDTARAVSASRGTGKGAFDVTIVVSLRARAGARAPRVVSVPVRWTLA
jgi:hypothetical protein